jgi:hypothetical protein
MSNRDWSVQVRRLVRGGAARWRAGVRGYFSTFARDPKGLLLWLFCAGTSVVGAAQIGIAIVKGDSADLGFLLLFLVPAVGLPLFEGSTGEIAEKLRGTSRDDPPPT